MTEQYVELKHSRSGGLGLIDRLGLNTRWVGGLRNGTLAIDPRSLVVVRLFRRRCKVAAAAGPQNVSGSLS